LSATRSLYSISLSLSTHAEDTNQVKEQLDLQAAAARDLSARTANRIPTNAIKQTYTPMPPRNNEDEEDGGE